MKKITKAIMAIALTGVLVIGASACKETVSAYDIAVKNGYTGTEAQWLTSLKGTDGKDGEDLNARDLYEAAKAEGYEGSFLDFCALLNVSVSNNNDTVQIAENVLSVVGIYCGYSQTTNAGGGMFGSGRVTEYYSQTGSGVIIDLDKQAGDAYIVTNYHVVYNIKSDQQGILEDIWVYPYGAYNRYDAKEGDQGGDGIKATYVGGAMDYDVAILKIEDSEYLRTKEVREAELGNSNDLKLGEETYVIGNPSGLGISVTNGVVSVPSEYIGIAALDNRDKNGDNQPDEISYRVIRTSAGINSGNSGGGMFDVEGKLIGIVNAKSGDSIVDNIGYALPITQVKAVYDNIVDNGNSVKQARLGIVVALKGSKAVVDEQGNLSTVEEFCVQEEANDSTEAAYGKLKVGDVFLSAKLEGGEEKKFVFRHQLTEFLLSVRNGQTATFKLLDANGQEKSVDITFGENNFTTYA